LRVHDTRTGKLLSRIPSSGGGAFVSLSPDGRFLAAYFWGTATIRMWDLNSDSPPRSLPMGPATWSRGAGSMAWAFDTRPLAFAGRHTFVELGETASGQVRRELRGHESVPTAAAFSPDGRLVATGSRDTTALVWKTWPDSGRREPLRDD